MKTINIEEKFLTILHLIAKYSKGTIKITEDNIQITVPRKLIIDKHNKNINNYPFQVKNY